jgi:hypothetical protein
MQPSFGFCRFFVFSRAVQDVLHRKRNDKEQQFLLAEKAEHQKFSQF